MLEKAKKGNSHFFIESLYQKYKKLIWFLIQKYTHDTDSYEDIFQDIFVRLIENAARVQVLSPQQTETYIALTVRSACIDFLRKQHKDQTVDLEDDFILQQLSNTKFRQTFDDYQKTEFALMLDILSPEDNLLLVGKYCLGMNTRELSHITGYNPATLRSRLSRIKKRLLEIWAASDIRLEDFFHG